jgi:hypothetical protein
MKYQVGDLLVKPGDIFVRFEDDVILVTEIFGDLIVGYWGTQLRNIGYLTYINEKVRTGSWKHYPVVK